MSEELETNAVEQVEATQPEATPTENKYPVPSKEEIKDPYAYAIAQKERGDRLSAKLIAAQNLLKEINVDEVKTKAATAIKKRVVNELLSGIEDEDLKNILAKDFAEKIELDDNFQVVDSNYKEKLSAIVSKIQKSSSSVKPTVIALQPPSAKPEEAPKDWKARLRYKAKQI